MSQIHRLCQNQFQKSGIIVEGKFHCMTHESCRAKYKTVSRTAANECSVHPGKTDATTMTTCWGSFCFTLQPLTRKRLKSKKHSVCVTVQLIKSLKLSEMKLSLVDSQCHQFCQVQPRIPNGHNTRVRRMLQIHWIHFICLESKMSGWKRMQR